MPGQRRDASHRMAPSRSSSSPSRSTSLAPMNTSEHVLPCRFTRELEQRLRNGTRASLVRRHRFSSRVGNLSEQGRHAYHLFINRYTSDSSTPSFTHDEHSSSMSSSSNQEKSDSQSLSTDTDDNRSLSSFHSRSLSTNTAEHSITGRPLPPPPDLSSLGSKLTTATMERKFNLPTPLPLTKSRTKSTPLTTRN